MNGPALLFAVGCTIAFLLGMTIGVYGEIMVIESTQTSIEQELNFSDPNTVVTFCKWIYIEEFARCAQSSYWHDDNYNIINEEHLRYNITVEEFRNL